MKILFMGGHELGKITLENLIEKRKKIVGVITPDTKSDWYSGVDKIANQYNLPLYKENNINSKEFIKTIDKINPDLIVSVNFNQIIGKEILSIPKNESINVHASLLPKYRGRAPLNWAIINGEEVTGVTVHYIDEGIDTGDIILQNEIRINEDDYIEDILNKVKEIYPLIVNKAVDQIQKGLVNSIPQKHDDGFYCDKRTPEDGQIKWSNTREEIYNLIRAVSHPYPGAYTYLKGKKVYIWKAKKIDYKTEDSKTPGTIVDNKNSELIVKCADRYLLLSDVDPQIKVNINDRFCYKEDKE